MALSVWFLWPRPPPHSGRGTPEWSGWKKAVAAAVKPDAAGGSPQGKHFRHTATLQDPWTRVRCICVVLPSPSTSFWFLFIWLVHQMCLTVVTGIWILIFPGWVMVLAKLLFLVLAENFLIAEKGGVLCWVCLWRALCSTYLPSCCALPHENCSGRSSRTLISVQFLHVVKL